MRTTVAGEIPKRLHQEPLIEAIWHLHFEPFFPESAGGDALVGVLYTALRQREQGRAYRILRLPLADIPHFITEQDPRLRYTVKFRLETEGPVLFQVGDQIISVNCRRPYVGWASFKKEILFLLKTLQESELIKPHRHGLRYLDLIEEPRYMRDLEGLKLKLQLGDREIRVEPLQLRVELKHFGHSHIVRIIRPAEVKLPQEGDRRGTLIDLETWQNASQWEEITDEAIEGLHNASKRMFFEQILTPKLIDQLEPVY